MEIAIIVIIVLVILAVLGNKIEEQKAEKQALLEIVEENGMETRLVSGIVKFDDGDELESYDVEFKGAYPVKFDTEVDIIATIHDDFDDAYHPMISLLDNYQEKDSVAFLYRAEVGTVGIGDGYSDWTPGVTVFPELLVPPHSGKRNLSLHVYVVDRAYDVEFDHGRCSDSDAILWFEKIEFSYHYTTDGYEDESDEKSDAMALSLKVAMAVAMADGSLDEEESEVIKNWISKAIAPLSEDKANRAKQVYIQAMEEAYSDCLDKTLELETLTSKLGEVSDKQFKYEAVDLCFEVMEADGVIEKEELEVIEEVVTGLNLTMAEVQRFRGDSKEDKKALSDLTSAISTM